MALTAAQYQICGDNHDCYLKVICEERTLKEVTLGETIECCRHGKAIVFGDAYVYYSGPV